MSQEELQIKAINDLKDQIHLNSYNLPSGFYRVDLLPFHDYDPSVISRPPENSIALLATTSEQEVDPTDTEELYHAPIANDLLTNERDMDAFEDNDEPLFDPITKEPLSYMDKSERLREHPLIKSVASNKAVAPPTQEPGSYRIAGFPAEELMKAFVILDYNEGYPTFENGDPFWAQLKYESQDAFHAFTRYLYMSGGAANKNNTEVLDTDSDRTYKGATGVRSLAELSCSMERDHLKVHALQSRLKLWSQIYYWDWRARAYDMFRVVQHRSQQEIRAIETQDDHYLKARKLNARAMEFMETEEFEELLTPKIALDMLRLGTNLERISAGLGTNGPSAKEGNGPSVISAQMSLRQVASNSHDSEEIDLGDGTSIILDQALSDPAQTGPLQELILKIQTGG